MADRGATGNSQQIDLFVNVDDRGTAKRTIRSMDALFSMFEKQKEMGKNMSPYPEMITGAGKVTKANEEMTVGFRGFRMEMLSVMFFGMALSRVFGQHVQNMNDMLGVTEMWNAVAEDMLLDVMLPMADAQFALAEGLMNLPQPIKAVVGIMMLATTEAGNLFMTIGQLTLGFDGLHRAFPGLFTSVGNLGKAIGWGGLATNFRTSWGEATTLTGKLGAVGTAGVALIAPLAAVAGLVVTAYTVFKTWQLVTGQLNTELNELYNQRIFQEDELKGMWEVFAMAKFGQETGTTESIMNQLKTWKDIQEVLQTNFEIQQDMNTTAYETLGNLGAGLSQQQVMEQYFPYITPGTNITMPQGYSDYITNQNMNTTLNANITANVSGGYDIKGISEEMYQHLKSLMGGGY